MVTTDDEDNFVFPQGMCETIAFANVGYGDDEPYPCADKALYTVHYRDFYPDPDGIVPFHERTEHVCGRCMEEWNKPDNLPDTIQFMFNRPYVGPYDGQYIEVKS